MRLTKGKWGLRLGHENLESEQDHYIGTRIPSETGIGGVG